MSEKNSYANQFFKFINTTVGRDKINRTLQYFFKFLLAFNIRYTGNEELIAWIRVVIKNIQLSRKFVRIGRPLEHLNKFYESLNLKDDPSKYCVLGRNLAYAIYLTFDMMVWMHKASVMNFENIKTISMNAQLFWLTGISFGILNQLYKLNKINKKISDINNAVSSKNKVQKKKTNDINILLDKQKEYYLTLIQYSCDFLQPMSSLRIFIVEPISLAIFGIISSIIGARTQWIKVNKK